jgi:uncharacterized membrane protein YesL
VLADVDWASLTFAGAFVVGAALATIAMLRVMRAVLAIFEDDPQLRRRQRRRPPEPPDDEETTP